MTPREVSNLIDAELIAPKAVVLPSGRAAVIPRFLRHETRALVPIPRVANCWAPNKPAILHGGQVTWAEFVLVRLLEVKGWHARWLKNWVGGREFCSDIGRPEPMPTPAQDTLQRIDRHAAIKSGGGAWDVFAWRGAEFLFLESKQHRSSDTLRPGQLAWLEAGLDEGFEASNFAVVEYDAGPPVRSTVGSSTRDIAQRTRGWVPVGVSEVFAMTCPSASDHHAPSASARRGRLARPLRSDQIDL